MPIVSVRIPQMGEGLQEARLVEFLKQPGDRVKRDEPIYVMETDKAITEVECPYEGTLVEWVSETNSVLPIGTEIARMEVAEGVLEMPAEHFPVPAATMSSASVGPTTTHKFAAGSSAGVPIPPRTRKYLREKGLSDVADQIPAAGNKLMPEDVDRYLAGSDSTSAASTPVANSEFADTALPPNQLALNHRLKRGAEACVSATIVIDADWHRMIEAREATRGSDEDETAFSMFVWCVVQSMKDHASFRSTLSADGKSLRTFHHVNIGVAVAIPGDLLRTAVVRKADTLDRAQFRLALKQQIEKVRNGEDQIDATTTMTVSNIGAADVRLGIPVVVKPAAATLALGAVFDRPVAVHGSFEFRKAASIALTFDHLIINGVGAANFLNQVRTLVENFSIPR